uniref:RRM domain-containing protein n=1 Tax=Glossina austeni TaxID=7395 RepID=A0A1A9VRE6_GLOAU
MASSDTGKEEIDEAEEEALLKSDDDYDMREVSEQSSINLEGPLIDEDFLINDSSKSQSNAKLDFTSNNKVISERKEPESDISSDNENDAEGEALKQYEDLLAELESEKYAYDKYVRLCDLSHATGDLDNIRKAYKSFSEVYPLTAELWLRYINVELKLAQSPNEIEKVETLFKRAFQDYYSCDLAKNFASFAPGCKDADIIWKQILSTYGLHCFQSRDYFQMYQKYLKVFSSNEDNQNDSYIESFLTELRYPHVDMEESFIEFKVFYEKNKETLSHKIKWEDVEKRYFRAKEQLQKILPFEEKLKTFNEHAYREKAETYFEYIEAADKLLDENVLQTIYERMVAECCLNADCWLKYIKFIEYRDEYGPPDELPAFHPFNQTADDISKRALRNCSWSPELYIKRMRLFEKMGKTKEEIQEILEGAVAAGFQTPEPTVLIWLEYLTYLRRHTDWRNENECDTLRKTFNLAWTILGQQWGVLADCNCEILQFWGRLEYGPLQDSKRGKELWTTVMESSDNASKSGLWIEFALLEMRRDLESTRNIFSKALRSVNLDNPSVISSAWERFERCNGTAKTLENCLKECHGINRNLSLKLSQHKSNIKSKKEAKSVKRKASPLRDEVPPKLSRNLDTEVNSCEKRSFKDHEDQTIDISKDHLRIFLSNLDYNISEEQIRAELIELKIVNMELIRSANGRSRGFGYAELINEDEVEKALAMDRKILHGRPLYISSVLRDKQQRQKFKYSVFHNTNLAHFSFLVEIEPQKLFVKGLPHDVTEEELKEIFATCGKIKDVRLVHHKSGKFKNIAYVEYEDESSAGKAVLALDKTKLRDHLLSVAISAPPPKPAASPSNSMKSLGIIPHKQRKAFDQKPRMSLIPNAVRKNFQSQNAPNSLNTLNNHNGAPKTNEDFRNLLKR